LLFLNNAARTIYVPFKNAITKMPGIKFTAVIIFLIRVIESFKNQFIGMLRMSFQIVSYINELIYGRISMHYTTVPNSFAIKKYYKSVIYMIYVDPIFLFHNDKLTFD